MHRAQEETNDGIQGGARPDQANLAAVYSELSGIDFGVKARATIEDFQSKGRGCEFLGEKLTKLQMQLILSIWRLQTSDVSTVSRRQIEEDL